MWVEFVVSGALDRPAVLFAPHAHKLRVQDAAMGGEKGGYGTSGGGEGASLLLSAPPLQTSVQQIAASSSMYLANTARSPTANEGTNDRTASWDLRAGGAMRLGSLAALFCGSRWACVSLSRPDRRVFVGTYFHPPWVVPSSTAVGSIGMRRNVGAAAGGTLARDARPSPPNNKPRQILTDASPRTAAAAIRLTSHHGTINACRDVLSQPVGPRF